MKKFKSMAFRCEEPVYQEVVKAANSVNLSIAKFLLALIKSGLVVFNQGGLAALKQTEVQES